VTRRRVEAAQAVAPGDPGRAAVVAVVCR
jgi:hypothetical protein